LLSTHLGNSRLLARPGDRRICVLDFGSSVLWDLHASGLSLESLAELLEERFGLRHELARHQVATLAANWRRAGLIGAVGSPGSSDLIMPAAPIFP
jgi:hypothetical protein